MFQCFISLGSNIEPRQDYLDKAILQIADAGHILAISPVLDNPALIIQDQPNFLNQILILDTAMEPLPLLHALQGIERKLGRKFRFRYGPREIDLDILFIYDVKISTPELTLPHPGLAERPYIRTLLRSLGTNPEALIESLHSSSSGSA